MGGYQRNLRGGLAAALVRGKYFGDRVSRKLQKKAGLYQGRLTDRKRENDRIRVLATQISEEELADIVAYSEKRSLIASPELLHSLGMQGKDITRCAADQYLEKDNLANALRWHVLNYLPGNGFVKTDRTTMAVSLESRTPFCDAELADFVLSLPFSMKVRGDDDKWLLRKAYQDKWTKEIAGNVKNGFSPPFDQWIRSEGIRKMQREFLGDPQGKIYHLLDYDATQQFLASDQGRIWLHWELIVLALWMETHEAGMDL